MSANDKVQSILKLFAIRAVILLIGWMVLYHGFIKPYTAVNNWLSVQVLNSTQTILNFLGYDTNLDTSKTSTYNFKNAVFIDGQPVVLVADGCNGLELMALFIGFLLSFPGPAKYKALIIPFGSVAVFIINVLREVILALNYKYFQETFDFNHKYTYVLIVYLIIFLIWRYWLNHYSSIGIRSRNE